jgi:DNA ligase-1
MSAIPILPTLYDKAKTGKTKVWSVKVETRGSAAVILTSHGYIDGKIQTTEREVLVGKNIGKKNETTPLQQAINEAQSDWNKKVEREGYKTSVEAVESISHVASNSTASSATDADDEGTNSTASSDIPRPMLAHPLDKRGKNLKYPCFAQRKLDGVRCLAISGKGPYSRNALPFENLDHIQADINRLPAGTILDGEVYSDTVKFQALVGLVKKKTLTEADKPLISTLYLCVYDIIVPGTYAERKAALEDIFAKNTFRHLRLLPTVECASLEDVKRLHAEYVAEGYEGIILRNKAGVYNVGNRSADLLKYKEFLDEEFAITGHTVGEGLEAGCVIWTCVTKEGASFSVRPRGTHEDRQVALATASAQVGKKLTVRFQEWTDDKKPRFPVGLAIRDYE